MKQLFSALLTMVLLLSGLTAFGESAPDEFPATSIPTDPYLVLVNPTHSLDSAAWTELMDFAVGRNCYGELFVVEKNTLEAFESLRAEILEATGIQIELDSTYRSVRDQQDLWDQWEVEYGLDYCLTYLSKPGCSEHHTGLAIDVFIITATGEVIRDNDGMSEAREDFAKIHSYLARHGFILHYLEGKEAITGYGYEPWHFRYVGDPDLATYLSENNLTLEEYYSEVF